MDQNDSIRLTRREFESLLKCTCGKLIGGQFYQAPLPFTPESCVKMASEASSDPATQKTLQDFLMGACG